MSSKIWGYVRVSTADQNVDRQFDLLTGKYDIPRDDIFVDKCSGTKIDRRGLSELQKVLRNGDKVVVESLTRVSRKTGDLLALLEDWHARGIDFVSDKDQLNISSALGRLQLTMLAGMAQFERDNLVERTLEGLAAARERGRVGGRPKTDSKKLEKAIRLYSTKSHSVREVCQLTGISKSVLYRALKLRRELARADDELPGEGSEN